MKLEILTVPNPILRQKSKPIKKIDKKIKKLATAMIQLISGQSAPERKQKAKRKPIGVGLSAVQIGKLIRLFVAFNPESKQYLAFINPRIFKKSLKLIKGLPQKENKYEGCLSIPGIVGQVVRHHWIVIVYQNLEGMTKTEKFSGLLSTVIQHENDHLEGILLTDKLLEQKEPIYRLEKTADGDKLTEVKFN